MFYQSRHVPASVGYEITEKFAGGCRLKNNVFLLPLRAGLIAMVVVILFGCAAIPDLPDTIPADNAMPVYIIGPGDQLQIFVWGNSELSTSVPVRPDGRITTPLVEDVIASGKTPMQLAREMEKYLSAYIKTPVVNVIVTGFVGRYSEQIRVIGEAVKPQTLPYRENMSLLDVMIAVGGLTEYSAGNRARIVRTVNGKQTEFRVRLDDLLKDGDISANTDMMPGDILIIPEAWF